MRVADTASDDGARTRLQDRPKVATRGRVLVVDDDANACRGIERLLRAEGFAAATAPDGEAALAEARRAPPDVVLTDLHMDPMDGVELCKRLHEIDERLPVIVMTAHSDVRSAIKSLRGRAVDYLVKPLDLDAILWSIDHALARRAARLEHERIQRTLNERLILSSIREHEHAEIEAQRRAQLNALLENLSDGVLIADRRDGTVHINRAARAILGLDGALADPARSLDALRVCDLRDRPLRPEDRPLERALRGETFADYEVLRVRPSGERRHVVSSSTNVRDESGGVALAIVVFRDVTELKRLERERDEYLALVSHDLRNPLSVVLMTLSALKTEIAEAPGGEPSLAVRVRLAERAERNAKRMVVMLDELREATALEGRGVELRRAPCNMQEILSDVIDSIDEARAGRIEVVVDRPTPFVVFADAPRLERVVANLLTNALRYSAADTTVTVRLGRTDGNVALSVTDHGIGIPPDSAKRLFERYYRTKAGKARARGLGLGLYIARMIVELHGGRIEVASEVGEGSTFTLVLPAQAAASPSP